jgi:uncharacterized protein (DUF885 family)
VNSFVRALVLAPLLLSGWPAAIAWADEASSGRLKAAIAKAEAWERDQFPEQASLRGQHAGDGRLTDLSDAAVLRRRGFMRALHAEVEAIEPGSLGEQERVSRELLAYRFARELRVTALYGDLPFGTGFDGWLPFSSLDGMHSTLVTLAQASRFDRAEDYENYLARLEQVPQAIGHMISRMQVAVKAGWIAPAAPVERVPDQLAGFAGPGIVEGPLMAPFSGETQGLDAAARERLARRARMVLAKRVAPAFAALKRFIEERYLPVARRAPLSASRLPAGRAYYNALVAANTTTSATAEEIHEIGLREVARIRLQMQQVFDSIGFKGDLREFMRATRADPAQQFASREAMLAGYRDMAKRADAELPRLFAELPRLTYGIRAMEPFEGDNAELYLPGSLVDGRAGYFMANVNRLDRRGRFEMEALLLHEAVPGHHLQIARAMENTAIPDFRRYGWETAYGEGWALYAETLGERMGFYRDSASKIGRLSGEITRACRLVVDTGLHRYDWKRQKAIDYLIENAGIDAGFAAAEVDRYLSIPGQALAYKMGELKIQALRAGAEAQLGSKFDLRRFHNAILDDGPLPLGVLDQRIAAWIARERARVTPAAP